MPAEWESHKATWMAWPHNLDTWPVQLEEVVRIWVEIIREIGHEEEVRLLVQDEREQAEATRRLSAGRASLERVSLFRVPTVDVWIRDYGPTFITGQRGDAPLAFNDWIFNAWGRKYETYLEDDVVAREMKRILGIPVFEHEIVLEGGSIDVNGQGSCLTTEQCLLHPNRNPRMGRSEIEKVVGDSLGIDHFIWLGEGIAGDDTDGHIDDIARFVNAGTVICALTDDTGDENYAPLHENYERLQSAKDQDGRKLSVIPFPLPGRLRYGGVRLPASYANFYIANGVVLVPTYNHENDGPAVGILRELFPGRRVVGIPCAPLVVGLGAIHCVTQQEPAEALLVQA